MTRVFRATLVMAAFVILLSLGACAAQATTATVTNATQFTDTTGSVVHAHGGGVIKVGSYYYWFGENRAADNTFKYVSAYRSTDLKTWEFRDNVLTRSTATELNVANIERPKVIYNSTTGKYVMWMHKENGSDYNEARAAVAVSDTVDGKYTWQGSFRPLGYMSRDITLFKDDDGTGYMISAANDNKDLHVYRLSTDYLTVQSRVQLLWAGAYREAPAMFKRNGVYFLLTSHATGWKPNQQRYSTSDSVAGTWSALADVGDATAYKSQTTYVLPIQGSTTTSYLYLGDRWGNSMGGTVKDSQYVWLPLTFPTSTTMTMNWFPQVSLDTATGVVTGVGGPYLNLVARHSGKCADVTNGSTADGALLIQYTCGPDDNQKWWLSNVGSGYYQIQVGHSGKCLDVSNRSTANGATIGQWTCNGGTNQQFRFTDAGGGYYQVIARHSGKCVDVSDNSTANGGQVIQWTCDAGTNQQWLRRSA